MFGVQIFLVNKVKNLSTDCSAEFVECDNNDSVKTQILFNTKTVNYLIQKYDSLKI